MKGQVQLNLTKEKESIEMEDRHLVHMTFRELWTKGYSDKRIWLRAVHIAQGKEVDERERFSFQIWKQIREQICCNITITNPTIRRSYNKRARRLGRRKQRNIIRRCACLDNGQHI